MHLISAEPIEVRKGVFALSGAKGTFDSKIEALNGAGVQIAELPEQIPELVKGAISL